MRKSLLLVTALLVVSPLSFSKAMAGTVTIDKDITGFTRSL
ncbi:hypothetical protein [Photobacterium sp. SKA34]|nr:hypothetical protein [Photobacterium sp. SKA34]